MEKAKIITELGKTITVQFNPAEYQISNSAQYTDKTAPGFNGAISQFVSGSNATLTLTLYFDTYIPMIGGVAEGGTNVALKTKDIVNLLEINSSLHRPPWVIFSWGAIQFKGILTDVKESYTMFLASGMPVRAKLEVTLKALYDVNSGKRKNPFESPDRTKYKRVRQGEQLWNYAYEEYENPNEWRRIAIENGLKHPMEIQPGQMIRIPAIIE